VSAQGKLGLLLETKSTRPESYRELNLRWYKMTSRRSGKSAAAVSTKYNQDRFGVMKECPGNFKKETWKDETYSVQIR
jgi:hypothetical protein